MRRKSGSGKCTFDCCVCGIRFAALNTCFREKIKVNEEEAVVSYYYCRYKKRAGSNCQLKLRVTVKDDSYEVAQSKGIHDHNEESTLTLEVKGLIGDLMADGKTAGQVRSTLSDKGFTPTLMQIENFIAREKRKMQFSIHC